MKKKIGIRFLTACFVAMLAIPAAGQGPSPESDDELSKRVDSYVELQMRARHIPGLSLAVIRDGKLIKAQGYGLANVEHAVPATPETAYLLASITKQFTAACVLMLAEEGKLSLDDPINKYLENAPRAWKDITIRELLGHTSGLKDRFEEDTVDTGKWRLKYSTADLYQAARQRALDFVPGTAWQYSDQGYFLLGMIIERASGQSYRDFLKKRIFEPLGMVASTTISVTEIIPHLANGYSLSGTTLVHNRRVMDLGMTSHFGIVSTVLDLAKWEAALREQRLLKRASYDLMWRPVTLKDGSRALGPLGSYGLGWFIDRFRGHRVLWHAGTTGTSILRLPDDCLSVVVLTNLEMLAGGDATAIARRIAAMYVPALRWIQLKEGTDPDPKLTSRLRKEQANLAAGIPDLSLYAPGLAAQVKMQVGVLKTAYAQVGKTEEFSFCESETDGPYRMLYYKVKYANLPTPVYVKYAFDAHGQLASAQSSLQ